MNFSWISSRDLADDLRLQPHLPPLGELDGVAQQIRQNLPQPPGIAHRAFGHAGRDGGHKFQAFGARLQRENRSGLPNRRTQRKLHAIQPQFPGFDARQIQDVID